MDGTFYFSSVNGHSVSGFKVCGNSDFCYVSVFVNVKILAFYDISTHKTNFAFGFKTEEFGRRNRCKVLAVDIKFAAEFDLSAAGFRIVYVVCDFEIFGFIFRIVCYNNFYGVDNSHSSGGGIVEFIADAVFKKFHSNEGIRFGNACGLYKFDDGGRSVASSSHAGKGGHSGVIPTVNDTFFNKLAEIAFAHYGIGYVKTCKLILMRTGMNKTDVFNDPVVERTVVCKFDGAAGIGDSFKCVLNRVCKVIKRIDAPFIALAVVSCAFDTVNCRVTHIHVGACKVDFCAESFGSVFEFSCSHAAEKVEVFFGSSVTVRAGTAGFAGIGTAVFLHFLTGEVIDICFAVDDKFLCEFIAFVKIVGTIENAAVGFISEPADIAENALDVFVIFACGVGIVIAKIELAVIFFCGGSVDPDRFCGTDMEVSVGFRRESGMDFGIKTFCKVFIDYVMYKVRYYFFRHGRYPFL